MRALLTIILSVFLFSTPASAVKHVYDDLLKQNTNHQSNVAIDPDSFLLTLLQLDGFTKEEIRVILENLNHDALIIKLVDFNDEVSMLLKDLAQQLIKEGK